MYRLFYMLLSSTPLHSGGQVDEAIRSVRKMLELDDKNKAGLALLKELQSA